MAWSCSACTFEHSGEENQFYLACALCGTSRPTDDETATSTMGNGDESERVPNVDEKNKRCFPAEATDDSIERASSSWGSLRSPTEGDVLGGRRKRRKVFDAPPPPLDRLVVLDFEWTADEGRRMEPVAEITQFPSVVMELVRRTTKGAPLCAQAHVVAGDVPLPPDLTAPTSSSPEGNVSADALAISAFDTFVRPTFNPTLTRFSIDLTAIAQEQVDAAPTIDVALREYLEWLRSLDMADLEGKRRGNWRFATWGDGDIGSTLRLELQRKSVDLPPCFDEWINLKDDSVFRKHYGRKPRGGLRACVESVGATWEGRAHNGLVDSINTAKIVRHMVRTGFRFVRSTRGLGKDGLPFGQSKKK